MIGRSLFCWEDDTYWRVVRVLDNGDLRAERVTPDGVRFLITSPDNPDVEIGRCMLRVGDVVSVRSFGCVRRIRLDFVGPTHVAGDEVRAAGDGYRGRWCGTREMLKRLWVDESDGGEGGYIMIGRSLHCLTDDTYWRVARVLDNGDLRAERVTSDGVRFLVTSPDNPDVEIGRCMLRVGDVVSVRSFGCVRRIRLDFVGPTHVAGDEVRAAGDGYRGRWCGTREMLKRLWVDESDRTA